MKIQTLASWLRRSYIPAMALCDGRAEWNLIVLAEKRVVIKKLYQVYQVVLFTTTATDFLLRMETARG